MLYLRRALILLLLLSSACQVLSPQPQQPPTPTTVQISSPLAPPDPTLTLEDTVTLTPSNTATRTPAPSATATSIPTSPTSSPTATTVPITTLLFTGVIVPARCVQSALDEIGDPDYPYEEVQEIIQSADLAIGTFNATMSDQVEHTGCVGTYQLVGSPDNADALARAGFDVMSVATNHIKDCGLMKSWCDYTFFDTLNNLKRVGILTAGAGANLQEALEPVVVTVNGVRFGIVSLGDSKLNPVVFAKEDHPGIAHLNEENMRAAIAAASAVSDVVIAMPHWGSEDIILPNSIQLNQAEYTVDAGADVVVGNHTHVIQAYQQIDGIQVFYGLGNFVFDQGLRDHRQGVILLIRFKGIHYMGYEMIPTHVDQDGRVHIADSKEAAEILERVRQASLTLR
ncbi:CapA family protein [Chloroflexota bacterium]